MARSGVLTDNLAQRSPAIAAMTLWLMQEHISIRLFWHRLRYVYTALTPRELVRIEKKTLLLLCTSDGLPCNGPYLTYAEQLWNTADLVCGPMPPSLHSRALTSLAPPLFAAVDGRAACSAPDHDAVVLNWPSRPARPRSRNAEARLRHAARTSGPKRSKIDRKKLLQ